MLIRGATTTENSGRPTPTPPPPPPGIVQFQDEMIDTDGDGRFEVPESPLGISRFRAGTIYSGEHSVGLQWAIPEGADGVLRLLRRVDPLLTYRATSGFEMALPPSDLDLPGTWSVVMTNASGHGSGFQDLDIPPVDLQRPKPARRQLGALYLYKLEITGGARDARSRVIATRIRGIDYPEITAVDDITHDSMHVHWQDNSDLASGFLVRIYSSEEEWVQRIILNGTTQTDLVVTGLSPDTEYGVAVYAWDYFGRSDNDAQLFRTTSEPAADPTDLTFDLNLTREDGQSGPIPYFGRFPSLGQIPGGTLRGVSLNAAWPALLIVKPGRSTSECNNPDAVVRLAPGSSLSSDEMKELFDSATPELPVWFVACAEPTPATYNWIPIRLTYRL